MLTLPDFKEKKLLYVTPKEGLDKLLRFANSNLCLYENEKLYSKVSLHQILALIIIGDCTLTTVLINKLTEYGISIYFLNYSLKLQNHINSSADGNYQLREKQYHISDQDELQLAKEIVKNKVQNQYEVLIKAGCEDLEDVRLKVLKKIELTDSSAKLLAHEGYFSSKYFPLLFENQDWHRRAPQTKEDPLNSAMDVGYTILFNYIDCLMNLFGFDCYKGIYHKEFYMRKSLVCDLMEPLRPLIDYAILKAINLKKFNFDKDFDFQKGCFVFDDFEVRKKYVEAFSSALIDKKEDIYNYVLGYYRHVLNSDKYQFRYFQI